MGQAARREGVDVSDENLEVPRDPSVYNLEGIKLLEGLKPNEFRQLEEKCQWYDYMADQTVVDRDDSSVDIFFIVKGRVRVMNFLGDGREVALADLVAGDHFGELSAVDAQERSARVVSSEFCVVASLLRDDFLSMLREHPDITLRLLDRFAGIIRALNLRVTALSGLSPRQRIFLELIRLAVPNPTGDGSWVIDNVPNHNEIASWSGTDRQEVAMAIGALAREGIMERKHKTMVVRDHARLRLLANL